jgi:cell division protein FtsI/penicillin-binding protein 2
VNTVFFEEYEPASIIKVLTLFTHLKNEGRELFPLQCQGKLLIDNKIFYDWLTHGTVSSYEEALAVSCNVAFARMGLNAGFEKLSEVLENFYFNAGELKDLFLNFKTGRYKRNSAAGYRLAKFSVGLSNNNEKKDGKEKLVTTTTFHSALISAFIAHNGSIYSPYLIHSIKNVLSLGFYTHSGEIIHSFKDHNREFFKVKEAMKEVVASPRGTGRRARVDFVKTAIKTGTAGDKKKGYDAILTGFFPADRPHYAFAFILQHAGKAELNGALFLKNFLISFYEK